MRDFIFFLFRPSYWSMNYTYSEALDDELKKLLETEDFYNIGYFRATIGGLELWINNHPYASFTFKSLRPSRRTIYEANKKLGKRRISERRFEQYQIELFKHR